MFSYEDPISTLERYLVQKLRKSPTTSWMVDNLPK